MPDALPTIAEISIAFAGFSGLIVALRRRSGPLTEVQKFRLRILLLLAFGAMFLSLLPGLLGEVGIAGGAIWRLSSALLSLYSLAFLAWLLIETKRMVGLAPEIIHWFAFWRMTAGHLLVVALQLAVIVSVAGDAAAGIYVAGLIWYLVHATQQFTRMLFVVPRDDS